MRQPYDPNVNKQNPEEHVSREGGGGGDDGEGVKLHSTGVWRSVCGWGEWVGRGWGRVRKADGGSSSLATHM